MPNFDDNKKVSVYANPSIEKKRTLFDNGIITKKTSLKHGVITPIYVREVYPGDTWIMDHTVFVRSDTTAKVPLDDVKLDVFYFYVPYRVIFPDFYKVFGEKRNKYDDTVYSIPQTQLFDFVQNGAQAEFKSNFLDFLIYRMNYSQAGDIQVSDYVSSLPLAAYYEIINDYFLDENLDPFIKYEELFNTMQFFSGSGALNNYKLLGLYQANKLPDLYTTGLISPSKNFGQNVTIPLGTSAPIIPDTSKSNPGAVFFKGAGSTSIGQLTSGGAGSNTNVKFTGSTSAADNLRVTSTSLVADLTNAVAADIQSFRTSLIIYSYYEMRGTIGTRRVEQLKQWGLDVSAAELDLPEYLGGESTWLSNVPVLDTTSAGLGNMAGVGATLIQNDRNGWKRSFNEMGIIIGLAVTRIKHSYDQGKDNRIWSKRTDLDFYHWIYEALGNTGFRNDYIYNDPTDGENENTFNFQPAWQPERTDWDKSDGIFSHMSGSDYTDFRTKWAYVDYYSQRPVFSGEWLKEDPSNVARTMTGQLIPGAGNVTGQQFMLQFAFHPRYARVMRSHARPANLVGVYW